MLPTAAKPSSAEPQLRKPKTPPDHPQQRPGKIELDKRNSFNSLSSFLLLSPKSNPIPNQTRTCLILLLSLLSLQLLLLLLVLPLRRHLPLPSSSPAPAASAAAHPCPLGRLYVYDLPPAFNTDHLTAAVSNSGLGPPAAASFAGVVPPELASSWYHTDQFAAEVIFHTRLLNHTCRTLAPDEATAFYVPSYSGLAVARHLFNDSSTADDRDRHCSGMLTWLEGQPYFRRSLGWDHFITMGRITWDFRRSKDRDWGSSCIYQPTMRNVTRLLIERNPWDYFDVGVPYPTGFHPSSRDDVVQWQEFVRSKKRTTLFAFAGAPREGIRNDFRGVLLQQCREAGGRCQAVDCTGGRCSNGSSAIVEAFLGAEFCLQPRGDSFTRRSVFDCMVAGAVPVLFWRRSVYFQYEWFLPGGEGGGYSVFIDREGVRNGTVNVGEVLGRFRAEEVRRMREKVVALIPNIVYARGAGSGRDALDVAVDGVLRRFKEQQEWDYKW